MAHIYRTTFGELGFSCALGRPFAWWSSHHRCEFEVVFAPRSTKSGSRGREVLHSGGRVPQVMISRSARSKKEDFCNSCVRHNVQRIGDLSVLQTLLSADATPFVGHVSLGLCVVDQRPLVFVAVQVASDCAQRSIRKDELQEL